MRPSEMLTQLDTMGVSTADELATVIARRREELDCLEEIHAVLTKGEQSLDELPREAPPKRKRGRPRKHPLPVTSTSPSSKPARAAATVKADEAKPPAARATPPPARKASTSQPPPPPVKRRRGRPPKEKNAVRSDPSTAALPAPAPPPPELGDDSPSNARTRVYHYLQAHGPSDRRAIAAAAKVNLGAISFVLSYPWFVEIEEGVYTLRSQ